MKRTFLTFLAGLMLVAFPVRGQIQEEKKSIKIAIMDFVPKGDLTEKEAELLSETIRNELVHSLSFEVVERGQMKQILRESALQMTGIAGSTDLIQMGKLFAVKQLILGTAGKLYGKIIITLRLVDAETGKNIFASTLYSTQESVFDDIKNIVSDLGDNAMIFNMGVRIEDIKRSIKDDEYKKAWFQLNRYRETNAATDEIIQLKQVITAELSEQYFKEAKRALRRDHFRDAKNKINYAIAIENREEYIKFRDRIKDEEDQFNQRIAMEKKKRELDVQRFGEDYRSFGEKVYEYYYNLDHPGLFLGASSGMEIRRDYKLGKRMSWYGCDLIGLGSFFSSNKGFVGSSMTGYFGLNFRYIEAAKDDAAASNEFVFQVYTSPFLSTSVKIGHLFLNLGLDCGGIIHSSPAYEGGRLLGVTGGSTVLAQFKYYRTMGFFCGAKFDYEYYPDHNEFGFYTARLMAGVVF